MGRSLPVLDYAVMFEVKLQTYWVDSDPAGIVYFSHFFRLVEQAEEEMYRSQGIDRMELIRRLNVWMPRVEAFSKFSRPIRCGKAVRVRLHPEFKGEKTIRYNYQMFDDAGAEKLAEGYVTVVCVDATRFKSTPIPEPIRAVISSARSGGSHD